MKRESAKPEGLDSSRGRVGAVAHARLKNRAASMRKLEIRIGVVMLYALAVRAAFSASLDASQILAKTSRIYANLQVCHLVVDQEVTSWQGGAMNFGHAEITLDMAGPARVRLAVKTPGSYVVVIRDGATTWEYVPRENTYTRRAMSYLREPATGRKPTEAATLGVMESRLLTRYADLAKDAKAATLKGWATVKVNGKKNPCYRIVLRLVDGKDKLWIDSKNFLVLQESLEGSTAGGFSARLGSMELRTKEIDITTPPLAELFHFIPPKGAREVSALELAPIEGSYQGLTVENFTLRDVEGKKVSLSDFQGKIVLLSFWATWCAPCREELPALQRISEQFKDKGVVVLAIDDERAGKIRGFLKGHHYSFTTLVDSKRSLFKKLGVRAIPTDFVIDRKRVIVQRIVGWGGSQKITAALDAVRH